MIEGFLIKYGNYLWIVKGCEHFDEYLIAYPRYDVVNQVKIKNMNKAIDIASKLGVLRYNECLKLEVPLINKGNIEYALDPFSKEHWPQLPEEITAILENLEPSELREVGLTGSYLASSILRNIKPRDVDLVIRDINVGLKIYNVLRDLRRKGVSRPLDATEDFEGTEPGTRIKLLQNRVLEGVLNNVVYSIRILSCKENRKPTCIDHAEFFSGELVIVEDVSSMVMPYIYIAENSEIGEIMVKSLRMRYSEIPVGAKLLVSNCRLEQYSSGEKAISLDNRECSVKLVQLTT
ncbi:MAG: hypothetical protein QXM43_05780 [Desulfurococcaceae archaeon]